MPLLQEIWNDVPRQEWETKPRKHVRASELGYGMVDRVLSMRGIEPSNKPDARLLRIFDTGKVIEGIILQMLDQVGLLHSSQDWIKLPAKADTLEIKGKLDAWVQTPSGGWSEVMLRTQDIKPGKYDEGLMAGRAQRAVKYLADAYPKGIEPTIVEVKSINSMAFWAHKRWDGSKFIPYNTHLLQLYAYLKMTGIKNGVLFYVSKDDLTLAEVPITLGDEALEAALWADLREIAHYMNTNTMPPNPPMIVFDPVGGKFGINPDVSRSKYLTYHYGYADDKALYAAIHGEELAVNKALRHIKADKVTASDFQYINKYNLMDIPLDDDTVELDEDLEA